MSAVTIVAESAPIPTVSPPAATTIPCRILSGCVTAVFFLIGGFLILWLIIDAVLYWRLGFENDFHKVGNFVGTAIIVLLPTWWLIRSWRRGKKGQLLAAALLVLWFLGSSGSSYRGKWKTAEVQEQRFGQLVATTMTNAAQGISVDTTAVSPESLGPLYPLARVLSGFFNQEATATANFEKKLKACGYDPVRVTAPKTLADVNQIRAARKAIAAALVIFKSEERRAERVPSRLLETVKETDYPEQFKKAFVGGMLQGIDSASAQSRILFAKSSETLRRQDALLSYLEQNQGLYSMMDGQIVSDDPALLTEVERRINAIDESAAACDRLVREHQAEMQRRVDQLNRGAGQNRAATRQ